MPEQDRNLDLLSSIYPILFREKYFNISNNVNFKINVKINLQVLITFLFSLLPCNITKCNLK